MEINLSDIELKKLRKLQKAKRGSKSYIKITVVLMLNGGFRGEDISYALGIDSNTVSTYKKQYLSSSNLDKYLSDNYVHYKGKLTKEEEGKLDNELSDYLYRSSKEVVSYIQETFGKSYTPTGVVSLLKRLGFSYKKTVQESIKVDSEKQEAFLEDMLAILENCEASNSIAYYLDGVHPQHNTRPEYGWIKSGKDFKVSANTGRKRVNINGALNPHDLTDVLIDETNSVNTQSTIRLMEKALQKHKKKDNLYFFSDNARYYKSKMLKAYIAENPKIKMVHLPAYSPNLNLIERLWKFMKKKVINSFYYEKYDEFKEAILDFFKDIKSYKQELETLLTLNFTILGQ